MSDSRAEGKTKELTANARAEALYAQRDANGAKYILLDTIVVYLKDPSVMVAQDNQVTVFDGKKVSHVVVSCVANGRTS